MIGVALSLPRCRATSFAAHSPTLGPKGLQAAFPHAQDPPLKFHSAERGRR